MANNNFKYIAIVVFFNLFRSEFNDNFLYIPIVNVPVFGDGLQKNQMVDFQLCKYKKNQINFLKFNLPWYKAF